MSVILGTKIIPECFNFISFPLKLVLELDKDRGVAKALVARIAAGGSLRCAVYDFNKGYASVQEL